MEDSGAVARLASGMRRTQIPPSAPRPPGRPANIIDLPILDPAAQDSCEIPMIFLRNPNLFQGIVVASVTSRIARSGTSRCRCLTYANADRRCCWRPVKRVGGPGREAVVPPGKRPRRHRADIRPPHLDRGHHAPTPFHPDKTPARRRRGRRARSKRPLSRMRKSSKSPVAWLLRTSESGRLSLRSFELNEVSRPSRRRRRQGAQVIEHVEKLITTRDGVRLAVRDYGSAAANRTVVLLHGLCLTQESWAIQIRHLRRHWGRTLRIISYDHRGHGRSAGAAMHTYRIDRLAVRPRRSADRTESHRPAHPGRALDGWDDRAGISRRPVDRPVEAQGLVLVATAAGRLTERGLGRLTERRPPRCCSRRSTTCPGASRTTRSRVCCGHAPRYPEGALRGCSGIGCFVGDGGRLPAQPQGVRPIPHAGVDRREHHRPQRRNRPGDPGRPRTRLGRRHPRCYASAPTQRRAHAPARNTALRQRRDQPRDGRLRPGCVTAGT